MTILFTQQVPEQQDETKLTLRVMADTMSVNPLPSSTTSCWVALRLSVRIGAYGSQLSGTRLIPVLQW